MRNINKLSPVKYLLLMIVGGLFTMIVYRATIFRCLFFNSFESSKTKLWLLWAVSLVVTYFLTFRRRRNYFSLFTNIIFPFGIYSVMTYDLIESDLVYILEMAIIILCGLLGIGMIFANKIPDSFGNLMKTLRIRLLHFLNGAKCITSVCLSVLMVYVMGLYAFDTPSFVPAVKPSIAVEKNKTAVIEKNMSVISKIDESIWKNLSLDERLNTLQTLANTEKVFLGISHEVNVSAESLGSGTYGLYDYSRHEIAINVNVIMDDDSTQAVTTLCHEVRHAYQHDSADAFLALPEEYQQLSVFDDMRAFYENIEDYKNAFIDGFEEYENQTIEVDSRAYGEKRSAFYTEAVDKYLADAA